MSRRQQLGQSRRWVVKIGSSLLTEDGRGLNHEQMQHWVAQIAALCKSGIDVVLVSSGAVAEGMLRLGWVERPKELYHLQAVAAVGQMGLVQAWESCFQVHKLHTAQVLLTHDDLGDRRRYLNARSTLRELINLGIIPVVNENDTVAMDEIRFGDNDTLAALVANLIEADLLVILTDQDGLYDKDPRSNKNASLIEECQAEDPKLLTMASGPAGALGRGGMLTKVKAATVAARSGASTVIAPGNRAEVLLGLYKGENIGTLLLPAKLPIAARKQWLASQLRVSGTIVLDAGAVKVLQNSGRSLLPVGVKQLSGNFSRGELVTCVDEAGKEIARGLINYNADETSQIMGHNSERIESILGYVDEPELIHRDNLVMLEV